MNFTRWSFSSFAALALLALAPAQELTKEVKDEVMKSVDKFVLERAFVPGVALELWPAHLEKQKAALAAAARPDDLVRAVNNALRAFGISHIRMLTPSGEKRRVTRQRTELGLRVQLGKNALVVLSVTPEGQAATQGIESGDNIVAIDGKVPMAIEELEGADGTTVALRLNKKDGSTREVELTRKVVSVDRPDTLTWLDDETAVLRIHTFNKGYDRKIIDGLCREAGKARYLLLDLRSNGGGAVNNLRHLLGNFLPPNSVIGTFVSRETVRAFVAAGKGDGSDPLAVAKWWERKFATDENAPNPIRARVAVLVNRGSASASEITAAALRESLDAPLVGARTAGAVLASTFGKLPHGFSLQYPQSDYVTAKGIRLEKQPLVPDLVVAAAGGERPASRPASQPVRPVESRPTRESLAADPVVRAALELIQKRVPKPTPPPPASRPTSRGRGRGGR